MATETPSTAAPAPTIPAPAPPAPAKPVVSPNGTPGAAEIAEDPAVSKNLAGIASREKEARKLFAQAEKLKKEAEADRAEIDAYRKIKGSRNPIEALRLAGYDSPLEGVREAAVKLASEQKPKTAEDRVTALEAELAKMRKESEDRLKAEGDAKEQQRVEDAKSGHRQQMSDFLSKHEEKYPELASHDDAAELMRERIWKHYAETFDKMLGEGEVWEPEKAAVTLESELSERATRAEAIRAKYRKPPELAPGAKPAAEAPMEVPKAGGGPEAKPEVPATPRPLEFDSMSREELDKVDPDSLSQKDRDRLVLAVIRSRRRPATP